MSSAIVERSRVFSHRLCNKINAISNEAKTKHRQITLENYFGDGDMTGINSDFLFGLVWTSKNNH